MRGLALALIHHPVLDRQGDGVTTAITNLDLHDISRSAFTYGLTDFFVVHPIQAQRELASRVRDHWVIGSGARRIPDRKPAMELLRVVPTLDAVFESFSSGVEVWTTSASPPSSLPFSGARRRLHVETGPPILLCLGTGWGLAPSVHERADERLEPIESPRTDGYNHLSVRAAAAIMLDRLSRAPGVAG